MPGCLPCHALVEKSTERRDARAGTDHDDRHGRIAWKAEVLRLLYINLDLVARAYTLGEEGGGDAEARAAVDRIAHRVDAQRNAGAIDAGRAGDGIEPRLQRVERLDHGFRIRANAGEFLDGGEHVEHGGVPLGVLAGGKRLRLLPPLAAGDAGEQLKQHIRRGPEGDAVDEHIAQRPSADREIRW